MGWLAGLRNEHSDFGVSQSAWTNLYIGPSNRGPEARPLDPVGMARADNNIWPHWMSATDQASEEAKGQ